MSKKEPLELRAQRKFKSASAFAQSDQNLHCARFGRSPLTYQSPAINSALITCLPQLITTLVLHCLHVEKALKT